jgi:hypothetical protein
MKEKIYLMKDWDPQTIRRLQLEDQEISDIFIGFEDKKRPEWNNISEKSAAVKTLWRQWDRLKIHGGMLYKNWVENEFALNIFSLSCCKGFHFFVCFW